MDDDPNDELPLQLQVIQESQVSEVSPELQEYSRARMLIPEEEKHVLLLSKEVLAATPKHSAQRQCCLENILTELKALNTPNSKVWTIYKIIKWYHNNDTLTSSSQSSSQQTSCNVRAFIIVDGVELNIEIRPFRRHRMARLKRGNYEASNCCCCLLVMYI